MKILQVNKLYYPTIGGIETIVQIISEGFSSEENGIDVLVCNNKNIRQVDNVTGIKVYRAKTFFKFLGMPVSFDFFILFFKIVRQYDKVVIHYPFPLASFLTFFVPKDKLIIYYHSDIIRQKIAVIPFKPFIKFSLHKASQIIVSGENIIKYSKALSKLRQKCKVIPFGLDFEFTDEDKNQSLQIKNKYSNSKIILGVGRLVYYKGFEYAIKAMKNVEAKLIVIGEGPDKDKLNKIIKELNLNDKVFILPHQDRLEPYFLACDIFVFPSTERSEAFGLVQLQAMAASKPIINTYLNTAVEEVSLNEITGLTVESKNIESLSLAINLLINKKEILDKYSENSFKRYKEFFTKCSFLDNLKEVILQ